MLLTNMRNLILIWFVAIPSTHASATELNIETRTFLLSEIAIKTIEAQADALAATTAYEDSVGKNSSDYPPIDALYYRMLAATEAALKCAAADSRAVLATSIEGLSNAADDAISAWYDALEAAPGIIITFDLATVLPPVSGPQLWDIQYRAYTVEGRLNQPHFTIINVRGADLLAQIQGSRVSAGAIETFTIEYYLSRNADHSRGKPLERLIAYSRVDSSP